MSLLPRGAGLGGGMDFSPVVDGKIIPVQPFDPVAAPTAANVPLIIGTNKDEATFTLMRDPQFGKYDEAAVRQRVVATLAERTQEKGLDEKADHLIAGYQRTRRGATPHDILVAISSDRFRIASVRLAERKAAGGPAPVYMYLFTWESLAWRGRLKSAHSFELPFVFNNMYPSVRFIGDKTERFTLANNMSSAWVGLARTGNPDHKGIPHWPTYSPAKRATMLFNTECRVENDPFGEERKLWDGII